jgi:cytochrome c oxidase subunit 3
MAEGLATTHEHAAHPALQHHFENMEQQREAGTLGMWVFLVTEIMFFGGMFLAYTLYRYQYPGAFVSASNHLDIKLGAINTAVLIVSSFTMAMAVYSTQVGRQRATILCLILTMILGAGFLGIKAVEYKQKYNDRLIPGKMIPSRPFGPEVAKPGETDPHKLHLVEGATVQNVELFYWIYFAMTSMHALHMMIGLGIMLVLLIMASARPLQSRISRAGGNLGIAEHFVISFGYFCSAALFAGRHFGRHGG